MTSEPGPRRRRGRWWGIAATIIASAGILAVGAVAVLGYTVDPLWGWMLFVAFPFSIAVGAIGGVLGVVGVFVARADRGGYAWPVVALVLGWGQVLLGNGFLNGWFI
ncbi:hypothetical protein ABC195_10015 [Microbacterium sp. 2P01SA-2]|uniref:hypothetical protein n=1 Tax=unclassified Microbacterium TaxID=2609290 RepID=UPI0039A29D9E